MKVWHRLRRRAFFGGVVASLMTPLVACEPKVRAPGGLVTGYTEIELQGEVLGEACTLQSVVWYPTAAGATQTKQRYDGVFLGLAAKGGSVASQAHGRPLVLLAHGLRGTRYDLSWLGERLAQAGYLAVAIAQPGVSAVDYDAARAPQVWRRAAQMSAALTALLAHPTWGPAIDATRVAAVGHSAGGSAVLALAGAEVDPALFARRYPRAGAVPAAPSADRRFAAVVGLAPGTARVFADHGLQRVTRPVLLVSGDKDWLTPERDNAARYAAQVPGAQWERLPGTGHYVFKPVCSLYGKLRARAICTDAGGIDRVAVHDQVSRWVRVFLAHALREQDPQAP